ncbi:hypothetical protein CO2235_150279 [Cupriavidus oxalaticus]|uniref:Uncharacterized protein n=1 Tax=Cupriavidus oxalaticus TaxID=96344 RepID=A0A375FZT5_9BURK|nr:hypothetical protein CO2235_150279 [Cupriavidus oxalaticus]
MKEDGPHRTTHKVCRAVPIVPVRAYTSV